MTKNELRAIVDQQISVISEASKEVVEAKELDLFTKTLMNVIAFRLTSFPDSEQLDLFDRNDLASYQAPVATSNEPEPIMVKGRK